MRQSFLRGNFLGEIEGRRRFPGTNFLDPKITLRMPYLEPFSLIDNVVTYLPFNQDASIVLIKHFSL